MTGFTMPAKPTLLQQTRRKLTAQETVAANVRAEFGVARLHATDLAALLDVSYPTALSRWHARTPYKVGEVARLAAFLECSVDSLFKKREEID